MTLGRFGRAAEALWLAAERRSVTRAEQRRSPPIEAFSIIAEVAVGLAGFAGIAVILGRGPGRWSPADAVRIRMLLYSAFGALFVSLLAAGLPLLGASPALGVRCTAGALVLALILFARVSERTLRRDDMRPVLDRRIAALLRTAGYLLLAAQLATVGGLAGRAGPGLVYLGLMGLLGYAAFAFIRLIFIRPADE